MAYYRRAFNIFCLDLAVSWFEPLGNPNLGHLWHFLPSRPIIYEIFHLNTIKARGGPTIFWGQKQVRLILKYWRAWFQRFLPFFNIALRSRDMLRKSQKMKVSAVKKREKIKIFKNPSIPRNSHEVYLVQIWS